MRDALGMELCTVVLEHDVPVDARKYGDLVASVLGVTRLEARIAVRKGRGIFLEDVGEQDARRLVEELARDGVRARCVPNAELPVLPAPRKATLFERGPDALRCRGAGGDAPTGIPWAQVDVVSIGAVALPEFKELFSNVRFDHVPPMHRLGDEPGVRDLLRENLILKMSAPRPPAPRRRSAARDESIFDELQQKYSGKLKVYADVVDQTRTLWMRIPMDEMAYAVEENAMKLGEAWGLHLLVHDLRERCARAFTEVALKFEPGADVRELVFLQAEDFNRYTAWHAVLHHLGMKPCANVGTSSPSPEPPAPSTEGGSSNASPAPEPPSTSS